ncbi:MAG: TAXI family TRAP transporter solute-binding subunit [Alphaproteobacteria bacterium]|nr:TAXI family TRAP transporter solute-binding subunit [Alphaproteobacteria bacterium]
MWQRLAVSLVFAVVVSSVARAEPITVGGSPTGQPLNAMATAIAKVANRHEGLDIRVQPFRGSSQYVPLVNAGELLGGVANALELGFAYHGTGTFDGHPNPNIRLITATYPFRVAFAVMADSGIGSVADLKGKRLPSGYGAAKIGPVLQDGLLANAGLTMADVTAVPITHFSEGRDLFGRGIIDAIIAVIGSSALIEFERRYGDLRVLPISDAPAAMEALRRFIPVAEIATAEPGPRMAGVLEPINVLGYKFFFFASESMPDDVAYKIAKATYGNKADLAAAVPAFNGFDPEQMAPDIGVPYHPGAIKFYKEVGLWQDRN